MRKSFFLFTVQKWKASIEIYQTYAKQVAQLSQRDRAAGWVSYGQKWKTGTGRQYFTDIIDMSSTTVSDVFGQQKNRICWKKRKIRAITPLKVIQPFFFSGN